MIVCTIKCESIDYFLADFTASVSLILHQLQQEQAPIPTRTSSITLSDEDTSDDESEQDSIAESIKEENLEIFRPVEIPIVQVKTPTNQIETFRRPSTTTTKTTKPIVAQTKLVKPSKSVPVNVNARKPIVTPAKKSTNTKTLSTSSRSSLILRRNCKKIELFSFIFSELNSSVSSLNSSHSDIRSVNKSVGQKQIQDANRRFSQSNEAQLQEQQQYLNDKLNKLFMATKQIVTINKQIHPSLFSTIIF